MKAIVYHGKNDVRVERVNDPEILNPRDAIIRVTASAICGSDLHLIHGYVPTMEEGDILGHEFMGIVEEVGHQVTNLKRGDRVVVPFTIACGRCFFCKQGFPTQCDNSNPNAAIAEKMMGHSPSGLFGYSHMFGGYPGGQAEFVRVPFADYGPMKIPEGIPDEKVLFLSDIFPTGWFAAENGNIRPGDTVAVWGCGPVGQFAIASAWLWGAARVIAIDDTPERLAMAAEKSNAETINFAETNVLDALREMTSGRGPDVCIDAVGMEAKGSFYDDVKTKVWLESGKIPALRECIWACRKGGTVSIAGVYTSFVDKFPLGEAFGKDLTFKMGQCNVHNYMKPLLKLIEEGKIDPSFVITHRLALDEAPRGYELFDEKKDGCVKVFLRPGEKVAQA
ncbi:MAG TPA: zinc-dependent alcohol dehydrogenase [Blastocatellia bacterium]|nr:zinc-dependent alcohol dehydrogenase [Blastocatellia bacterium]